MIFYIFVDRVPAFFHSWKPLKTPGYGVSEMKRWKLLFELDKTAYAVQVRFVTDVVAIPCYAARPCETMLVRRPGIGGCRRYSSLTTVRCCSYFFVSCAERIGRNGCLSAHDVGCLDAVRSTHFAYMGPARLRICPGTCRAMDASSALVDDGEFINATGG